MSLKSSAIATEYFQQNSIFQVVLFWCSISTINANLEVINLMTRNCSLFAEIRQVIREAECYNCLIASDLNCQFSRQNRFTILIQSFIEELGFRVFWSDSSNQNIQPVDYTPCSVINGAPKMKVCSGLQFIHLQIQVHYMMQCVMLKANTIMQQED